MGVVWIGLLGSFAALILRWSTAFGADNNIGTDTLFLIVLGVVANDIGALALGSSIGKTPLRQWISPGKTFEGLIGGTLLTFLVLFIVGLTDRSDTWSTGHLMILALVIAVFAPLGDLTESMFKRNLDVKDFGAVVTGHGGVLDRFDAFLFVLPVAYYVTLWLEPWTKLATIRGRHRRFVRLDRDPDARRRAGRSAALRGRRPRRRLLGRDADRPGPGVPAPRTSPSVTRPGAPRSPPRCPTRSWSTTSPASSSDADVVVNAVVGFAGLPVTLATLRQGKRLALANKESLIAAGPVVQPLRATPGAELVPVDSEHCAVHQCLRSSAGAGPGGRPPAHHGERRSVPGPHRAPSSPPCGSSDALAHPTWSMGPKITIDSSTLDEQGPRGHRGPRAVRHRLRRHRRRRAPAVRRPLDGRVHRRLDDRPAQHARHAPADRLRPRLAGPHRDAVRADRLGDARRTRRSRRRIGPRSCASTSPTRPDAPAAPRRRALSAANEVAVEAFLAGRDRVDADR